MAGYGCCVSGIVRQKEKRIGKAKMVEEVEIVERLAEERKTDIKNRESKI